MSIPRHHAFGARTGLQFHYERVRYLMSGSHIIIFVHLKYVYIYVYVHVSMYLFT